MNKKNIPYIITYILEILLVLLGAIFYRQPLLSVLLLLLALLVPLSILLTKHEIDKLEITATPLSLEVMRNGILNVKITTNYKGFVPLLNCVIKLTYENLYYPHPEPQEFVFPAEARKNGEFTLPFSVTKSGMVTLKMTSIDITDYLHLYTFTRPLSINLEIPVTPENVPAPAYPRKRVAASASDGDPSEVNTVGGERTQDIKQLREYRVGDRLKDVHWKLTAKTDEMMIREFEEIKELYYLIFPVLTKPNLSEDIENVDSTKEDSLQDTLDVFLAIGKDLIREREPFSVAIYHSEDNTFTMKVVTEEEDLYFALYELYRCPIEGYEKAYDTYVGHNPAALNGMIRIEDGKVVEK